MMKSGWDTQLVHVSRQERQKPQKEGAPNAPYVEDAFEGLLHGRLMKEGDPRGSAGHVDYDLPQRANLVFAALAVGDVVVLRHQLCILPPLSR